MPYLCTRFCAEVRLSAAKHGVLVNASPRKSHREVAQLVAHHVRDVGGRAFESPLLDYKHFLSPPVRRRALFCICVSAIKALDSNNSLDTTHQHCRIIKLYYRLLEMGSYTYRFDIVIPSILYKVLNGLPSSGTTLHLIKYNRRAMLF